MKITYVNIRNETIADYLKSAYVHTPIQKDIVHNKVNLDDFLTKTFSFSTVIYSFNEEIKNKIMFDNNNFQLGEINQDLTLNIEVYNNSPEIKEIEEINIINLYGLNVNVPTFEIYPYQSVYLTVNIAATGESDNNGFIQLVINGQIFYIVVNYSRQAIFSYMIDRSDDLPAAYTYSTEVKESISGKEVREGWYDVCRFTCDYNYKFSGDIRRKFENELINNKLSTMYLPIYFDKVDGVADIANLKITGDFRYSNIKVGSSVFAYSRVVDQILDVVEVTDNYIIVEKLSDKFSSCYVYPLVRSRLSIETSGSLVTKDFSRYLITFDIDEYASDDMLAVNKTYEYLTINGKYLFSNLRRNTGEEEKTFVKKAVLQDNNTSIRAIFIENSTAREVKKFNMKLFNRDEIARLKDTFKKCRGMEQDFYIIKDDKTLKLLEDIQLNDTIIKVVDANHTASFNNFFFDYVYISYGNNKTLILKVNEVRKDENNQEILLIDFATSAVNLSEINFVSYICRARFFNDTLSINYKTNNVAETSIELITINKF